MAQPPPDPSARYCPVCRQWAKRGFRAGPSGRLNAQCRRCKGLERHRFLALLVSQLTPGMAPVDLLVDIAPTPALATTLEMFAPRRTLRLDIGHDKRRVDVLASVTELPLADDSVDVLVCYHVLEHVWEDRRAMAEIGRVLSPRGIALVQVPIRWGTVTDEDLETTPEERQIRFGQRDHVRFYGDDFEDRLREARLSFSRVTPVELLGPEACRLFGMVEGEPVWILRPGGGECREHPGVTALPAVFGSLITGLEQREVALRRARARVRRLSAQVERSQNAPSKFVAAPQRLVGRVTRRLRPPRG